MCPPRSRRRFLSLCVTGGAASLAGCSAPWWSEETRSTAPPEATGSADGLVWQKEVQVELDRTDSSVLADVLRLQYDRDRDEVFGAFDAAYVDSALESASVTASRELHDRLTSEFGRVNYKVKLGPVNDAGEHLHARARRVAFNELPLAGRASVERFWVRASDDLRVGYVRPTETDPPGGPPATVDVGRLDLGATHEGY